MPVAKRPPRKPPTHADLAQRLAEVAVPTDPPDLDDLLCTDPELEKVYAALCEQIRARYREHENAWKYFFHSFEDEPAQRQVLTEALAEPLRDELYKYSERWQNEAYIDREAAYLVGVYVGRRWAGVR